MKIDGYWTYILFAVILIFGLGMASVGAKKNVTILGAAPTPTQILPLTPTLPPPVYSPTPGPSLTLAPGAPTYTPAPPTVTPIGPSSTPPSQPPSLTPTSPPCPAQTALSYNTANGISPGPDSGQGESSRVDIRLALRPLKVVNEAKSLVTIGGPPPDTNAPQFATILGRYPTISQVYWAEGELDNRWPVNVMSLATTPGDSIRTAQANYYPAGSPNGQAVVLYAQTPSLSYTYKTTDGVLGGYTIYVEGICVNPGLENVYNQYRNVRTTLPILARDQVVGVAKGSEIRVAIRDGSGSMMDPRSKTDWWQGY